MGLKIYLFKKRKSMACLYADESGPAEKEKLMM